MKPRSNVTTLRPIERPYDHETEDEVWAALAPIEWSYLQAIVERTGNTEAIALMRRVGEQVVAAQLARIRADILDARHNFGEGA